MSTECQSCGTAYALREGCEPTPLCDPCAQDMHRKLRAEI